MSTKRKPVKPKRPAEASIGRNPRTDSTPGPKPHPSGSLAKKITMSCTAWRIVESGPGGTTSRKLEGIVMAKDAIDKRNGIGGGI